MFTIKDGAVVATFGENDSISLSLKDVKLDRDMLALVALQRVSRETVAGKATDAPAEAKVKLQARWDLWKQGKWESERSSTPKLSEQEVHELAMEVLEFRFRAAGLKPADIAKARKLIEAKDAAATTKFQQFCKDNAKSIKQRMREVLKARKEAETLKY